jgi:hypothetical protein
MLTMLYNSCVGKAQIDLPYNMKTPTQHAPDIVPFRAEVPFRDRHGGHKGLTSIAAGRLRSVIFR